jgi:hypothetical protein
VTTPYLQLRKAPAQEIEKYYEWFMATLEQRLKEFEAVYYTTGGEGKLNRSSTSLGPLASWLKQNVEYRYLTEEELAKSKASSPAFTHDGFKQPILTEEWLGRISEIGAYFGEVLRKSFPALAWGLSNKKRKWACFGHPVVMTPTGFEVPVLDRAHVFLLRLHKSSDPATDLIMVFHQWKAGISRELAQDGARVGKG